MLAIIYQNTVLKIALTVLVIHQIEKCGAYHLLIINPFHLQFRIITTDCHLACLNPISFIGLGHFFKVNEMITFCAKLKHKVAIRFLPGILQIWSFTVKNGCPMSCCHI